MPLVRVISRKAASAAAFRDIPAAIGGYKKRERRNCAMQFGTTGLSVGSCRNEFWRRLRPTNFSGSRVEGEGGGKGGGREEESFATEKKNNLTRYD